MYLYSPCFCKVWASKNSQPQQWEAISNADESKKGATKEDLDNMRGVLQRQVDEKMPWLSDVLGEHLDKLISSSSSDSDD